MLKWEEGEKRTEVMEGGRSQNAVLVIIIIIRQVFQSLQREVSLQPLHWNHKITTNAYNNKNFS